jgi:lipopolysaccharide export system ATP-binding protein
MSVLEAKGLEKTYHDRKVVNDVSFCVNSGEVVSLLGPNGAGKTTSFYLIVGLAKPDKGSTFIDDQDISQVPMYRRAKMGLSYLPQNTSVFRKLSVRDNLLAVMEIVQVPKKERADLLDHLLKKFQIAHIANTLGLSLSGGERRRVEVARALIIKPRFLLLDEPFAGVDPVTVQEIQNIIHDLKKEGLGVLITDHNVRETLGSSDRAYILHQGAIIAQGTPDQILANEQVRHVYLGDRFKF